MKQTDPKGTFENSFQYDRLNQLSVEKTSDTNQLMYDSLGNCLSKNEQPYEINDLNQLLNDGENAYTYDANGNLITQSHPPIMYTYDALNRLTSCNREDEQTTFLYDFSGRCLQISDTKSTKHLLYQGEQEIGSLLDGKLHEFRLVHPESKHDLTFAIEVGSALFFPIQDYRGNICALQNAGGDLPEGVMNPWRFANRREVAELCLFTHRLYNPRIMRWQTADPLGFEDGLHLYQYAHNNPFYYKDLDGQFAFILPLVFGTFGAGGLVLSAPTIGAIAGAAIGAALGWGVYEAVQWNNHMHNQLEEEQPEEEQNTSFKKPPVRTEPRNLEEQLALEEARNNNIKEIDGKKLPIKDLKYPKELWAKKTHVHEVLDESKIEIHCWECRKTTERHGFKFKDKPPKKPK
jgi:RHS repeat-associated protein